MAVKGVESCQRDKVCVRLHTNTNPSCTRHLYSRREGLDNLWAHGTHHDGLLLTIVMSSETFPSPTPSFGKLLGVLRAPACWFQVGLIHTTSNSHYFVGSLPAPSE